MKSKHIAYLLLFTLVAFILITVLMDIYIDPVMKTLILVLGGVSVSRFYNAK